MDTENQDGLTALQLAEKEGLTEIREILSPKIRTPTPPPPPTPSPSPPPIPPPPPPVVKKVVYTFCMLCNFQDIFRDHARMCCFGSIPPVSLNIQINEQNETEGIQRNTLYNNICNCKTRGTILLKPNYMLISQLAI